MNRVADKVAVVTGGAQSIGQAACELLAREGAKVAVTDILDEKGRRTADRITAAGGSASYWHLDVTDEDQVQTVFSQVADTFGKIDVLVNNAGIADLPSLGDRLPGIGRIEIRHRQ